CPVRPVAPLLLVWPQRAALYWVWAGAYRVIEWDRDSFVELRALVKDTAIVSTLEEIARRHGQTHTGALVGETCLSWIVDDTSLPVAMRFRAADEHFLMDE